MFRKNYSIIEPREYDLSVFDIVDERKKAETHWYHIMPEQWAVFTTLFKRSDKPRTWGVMKVEIEKNGEPYMEFLRNYPSLPFLYIEQNGEEFAITSTDYQCITIINLTTKEIKTYSDLDDLKYGSGFCPIGFDWDEGDLYVDGCVWGCPEETMIARDIDLKNPIDAFNNADWQSDYDDETYCEDDEDWEDETENC